MDKQPALHTTGIDVRTKDANKLKRRLRTLKTTLSVDGPFPYREDPKYSQLHLLSTLSEPEVDNWLYRTKHGCEYIGTWVIAKPEVTE